MGTIRRVERGNDMKKGFSITRSSTKLWSKEDNRENLPKPPPRFASDYLDEARAILDDRGKHYSQGQERNMERIVTAFKAMTGKDLTEVEGWLFMVALKAVRSGWGQPTLDSFKDGIGYFALAAEAFGRKKE